MYIIITCSQDHIDEDFLSGNTFIIIHSFKTYIAYVQGLYPEVFSALTYMMLNVITNE